MNKKITLMIICILILSGCKLMSPQGTIANQGGVPNLQTQRSGNDGVVLTQIQNIPPKEIFENEEFKIGLELVNKGASDTKGTLKISGFNPLYFESESYEKSFNLAGKTALDPVGELKLIEINMKNKGLPVGSKKYTAPYQIKLDYNYETISSAEVCINPNIYQHLKLIKDTCKPGEVSLSSQGGPVGVTNIKEYISSKGSKIYANYELTVKNIGSGKVKGDNVTLEKATMSNNILECKKTNMKLVKDKTIFTCSTEISKNEGVYKTILTAKIIYDYEETKKSNIIIKK